jgi:hypothetical protein
MNYKALGLLSLLLSGCAAEHSPVKPPVEDGTGEEYQVYRTLVADSAFNGSSTVLFCDSTQAWDFPDGNSPWKSELLGMSDETIRNYLAVNRTPVRLKHITCPGITCILISSADMAEWQRLYPGAGGVVTVSRVGFNSAETEALVYWSVYRAARAARGSIILLQKENEVWTVRQELMIWTS